MKGTVRSVIKDKGYGFIRASDGKEYFFHYSGCLYPFESFTEGVKVDFSPTNTAKGPRAEEISLDD